MSSGLALTQDLEVQVISSYVSAQKPVPAVSVTPGWYSAGAFRFPATEDVRLEIFGCVSDPSLTLRARLFALYDDDGDEVAEPVSGSEATLSSTVTARAVSGIFELTGGRTYEVQFEVTGGVATDLFGILMSAQPTNT